MLADLPAGGIILESLLPPLLMINLEQFSDWEKLTSLIESNAP